MRRAQGTLEDSVKRSHNASATSQFRRLRRQIARQMPALPQSDEPPPSIARRANYTISRANGAVLRIEWSWPGMARPSAEPRDRQLEPGDDEKETSRDTPPDGSSARPALRPRAASGRPA